MGKLLAHYLKELYQTNKQDNGILTTDDNNQCDTIKNIFFSRLS